MGGSFKLTKRVPVAVDVAAYLRWGLDSLDRKIQSRGTLVKVRYRVAWMDVGGWFLFPPRKGFLRLNRLRVGKPKVSNPTRLIKYISRLTLVKPELADRYI